MRKYAAPPSSNWARRGDRESQQFEVFAKDDRRVTPRVVAESMFVRRIVVRAQLLVGIKKRAVLAREPQTKTLALRAKRLVLRELQTSPPGSNLATRAV